MIKKIVILAVLIQISFAFIYSLNAQDFSPSSYFKDIEIYEYKFKNGLIDSSSKKFLTSTDIGYLFDFNTKKIDDTQNELLARKKIYEDSEVLVFNSDSSIAYKDIRRYEEGAFAYIRKNPDNSLVFKRIFYLGNANSWIYKEIIEYNEFEKPVKKVVFIRR